jgi:hypothetical protein
MNGNSHHSLCFKQAKNWKFNTTSIHELQSKQQLSLTTTSFANTIRETSQLNSKNYTKKKRNEKYFKKKDAQISSHTSLMARTCPLLFLTFLSFLKKYL